MNDQAFPYTLAFLRVRKELEELLASLLGEERHQTGRLSGRFSLNLEPVSQPPPPKGCKGLCLLCHWLPFGQNSLMELFYILMVTF